MTSVPKPFAPGLGLVVALAWGSLLVDSAPARSASAARELCEEGREALERRGYGDLQTALERFRRASALDPDRAEAWAGLAQARALLARYGEARTAAARALALDPRLGTAHAALGFSLLHGDWDWRGAERSLDRAVELAPASATARLWHAIALEIVGRSEEAVREAAEALELRPQSPPYRANLGYRLFWARRFEEAARELGAAGELDPESSSIPYFLGRALTEKGDFEGAERALAEAKALAPRNPNVDAARAYLAARSGNPRAARAALAGLRRLAERGYPLATWLAALHAALGEDDAAFDWLERAFEAREGPLAWVAVDPRFDSLRGEAPFRDLLRRLRLAPEDAPGAVPQRPPEDGLPPWSNHDILRQGQLDPAGRLRGRGRPSS